jgi:hypothetical protein
MIRAISIRTMTILCSVFCLLHIVLGVLSLDMVTPVWPPILAMVLDLVAVVIVLSPTPGRLSIPRTVVVLVAVTAMTLLVNSALPTDTWPGYASWHLAATYTLLVVVNLRGRVALSWIGVAISVGLVTWWASGTSLGPVNGLLMNVATVGWLTIATLIGQLLGSNDRQVADYSADARAAADWYAAERAINVSRTDWLSHVKTLAYPALTMIADQDHVLTSSERQELRLIEAQFRDEIRGRVLATDEVIQAARRARERGVTVQIIDDRRQDLEPLTLAAASQRMVSILDHARGGTLTARARPRGGANAVTILTTPPDSEAESVLVVFPDAGTH